MVCPVSLLTKNYSEQLAPSPLTIQKRKHACLYNLKCYENQYSYLFYYSIKINYHWIVSLVLRSNSLTWKLGIADCHQLSPSRKEANKHINERQKDEAINDQSLNQPSIEAQPLSALVAFYEIQVHRC